MGNRDRGVLTDSDREYLRLSNEERFEEYSAPARSQRWSAIRDRVSNAILDYPLLADELEDDRLEDIVDDVIDAEADVPGGLVEGLKAQARFVYRVSRAANLKGEELIEDAIDEAKESRTDVLKRRFENDQGSLTLNELSDLYEAGEIPDEEYSDLFRDALEFPNTGGMTSLDALSEVLEKDIHTPDEADEDGGE